MRRKFAAKPAQIESRIDLPDQVILGDRVAETKLVEQLTLVTLQTAHHRSTSPRFALAIRNHASRPVSTDFCHKIGTFRPCRDFRVESALGCKAEVGFRACQGQLLADFVAKAG